MANEPRETRGCVGWFLLGAAVGAAVGLLTTPRTGHETRELLAERGEGMARRAQELAETHGGDWFETLRALLEEQTQRVLAAFEAARTAMRDEMARRSASRE